MRSALFLPPFDALSDPGVVAHLAIEAEEAGWHGVFLWDHVRWREPVIEVADAWITLAAIVIQADGTEPVQITHQGETADDPNRSRDHAPAWSPSGDRLVFERYSLDHRLGAIFTVAADGSDERRITPWRLDAAQPDWSPDGRWIIFRTQADSERDGDIFMVHPNGGGLHRVVGGKGKWLSCSFSPSGKKIQAGHVPGGGGRDAAADIFVFELDGSHMRNLTESHAWESASDWGPRPR